MFGSPPSTFSTSGLSLAKVTAPGPRYLVHVTVTGGPRFLGRAPELVVSLASSETQTVRVRGFPTLAVRSTLKPRGPCTIGPDSPKPRMGGVLPTAAS